MGGFGVISGMINSLRDNAALLNKHKSFIKRREGYHHGYHENESKPEYDFPEIAGGELKRTKVKFRKRALRENRREIRKSIISGMLIVLLIVIILKYLGQI